MKRVDKVINKLVIMFGVFLLVVLTSIGFSTYYNQTRIVEEETLNNIRDIGDYLAKEMEKEGDEFISYQKIYFEHFDHVDIPIDADSYLPYKEKFDTLFVQRYPGKTLGTDIKIEDMDDDLIDAYLTYKHFYWIITFENVKNTFDLSYVYYLVPHEDTMVFTYFVDYLRTSRAEYYEWASETPEIMDYYYEQGREDDLMYLNSDVPYDYENYKVMWDTWYTGEKQDSFQVWHNDFGNTYSYCVPVFINGQKLGMVTTEVDIANVNNTILSNTFRQLAFYGIIFLIATVILIVLINNRYIKQIVNLDRNVRDYTNTKETEIADKIKGSIVGKDEIATLSEGIVSMIYEIKDYINSLIRTNQELDEANENVTRLDILANKDSLTDLGNSTAYLKEIKEINRKIANGENDIGLAMIDLNYLKIINDEFGHEKGNIALIKIGEIINSVFKQSGVYRIGGDEFVVVLKGDDLKYAKEREEEFRKTVNESEVDISVDPWERVSASIGVVLYEPGKYKNHDELYEVADQKMYKDKQEHHITRQ